MQPISLNCWTPCTSMGSVEDADGSIAIGNFNLKVLALQVSCFSVNLLPLPSPCVSQTLIITSKKPFSRNDFTEKLACHTALLQSPLQALG